MVEAVVVVCVCVCGSVCERELLRGECVHVRNNSRGMGQGGAPTPGEYAVSVRTSRESLFGWCLHSLFDRKVKV